MTNLEAVRQIHGKRQQVGVSMKILYGFVFLTAMFSTPIYLLYAHAVRPATGTYISYLMWCPGLAGLVALGVARQPLSTIGWAIPKLRHVLAAILVPLAYLALSYGLIWIAGWGGFPNWQYVDKTAAAYVWTRIPSWVAVILCFVVLLPMGLVNDFTSAAGEEIGWRGLLAPRLNERIGYFFASLITGVIWAAWHYPLFFRGGITSHLIFPMSCFTATIIGLSFFATWLRVRSGSVWPAAVFHAAHNAMLGLFNNVTISNDKTDRYADETGILLAMSGVILAVAFTAIYGRTPQNTEPLTTIAAEIKPK